MMTSGIFINKKEMF